MTAEFGIYDLLKGLAGGRVYALRAPQNVTTPFIIYQRVSSGRWRSINAPSGLEQATIQIDVYADNFAATKALAIQIEDILDGYRGTVYYGGDSPQKSVRIAGISLVNDEDVLDQTDEPFLYRNIADYLVTYERL